MAANNPYATERITAGDSIYTNAVAVTPHDTNELASVTKALWIGGAGNLVLVMTGGGAVTLSGIPAGTLLPLSVRQVKATLTTATLIVALY